MSKPKSNGETFFIALLIMAICIFLYELYKAFSAATATAAGAASTVATAAQAAINDVIWGATNLMSALTNPSNLATAFSNLIMGIINAILNPVSLLTLLAQAFISFFSSLGGSSIVQAAPTSTPTSSNPLGGSTGLPFIYPPDNPIVVGPPTVQTVGTPDPGYGASLGTD
jgi:hypothetical protein